MQPEETETDSTLRAELQSDSRREPSTKEARKPAAKKEAATEGPQIPVTGFIINDLRVRSVPGLLTLTHRFPGRGTKRDAGLASSAGDGEGQNQQGNIETARRMNTSRAALDRLLDPRNASVTLQTLACAAHAFGRDLRIELV